MPAKVLEKRRERFCQLVADGKSYSEAYTGAGFRTNRSNAGQYAKQPDIQARIDEIMATERLVEKKAIELAVDDVKKATGISITKAGILEELARIAHSNIYDFVDLTGESPSWALKDIPRELMASVSELTTETVFEKRGSGAPVEVRKVKLKFWDKKGALVDLGKGAFGMFKERVEHSGDPDAPIVNRIERVIVDPRNPSDPDGTGLPPASGAKPV
jgi:hypothetical protein